jgi:hypothetical protein
MGLGGTVGKWLRFPTGLLRMIVCHGEQEIPEGAQAMQRLGLRKPRIILGNDLFERRIPMRIEVLPPQLIIHTIMDCIEPFYQIFLVLQRDLQRMLFVVVR